tara:strand:- start:118 stop:363 length:246 start_codon:yes stop_codon:yes gene_type:complete
MNLEKMKKKELIQLQEETMAKLEDMTYRVAIAKEGIEQTTEYINGIRTNAGTLRGLIFDLGLDTESRNEVLALVDKFIDTL